MPVIPVSVILAAALLLVVVFSIILIARLVRANSALRSENLRLSLEHEKALVRLDGAEEDCRRRLEEKDAACRELLRRGDDACQRLLREQFVNIAAQTLAERQKDLAASNAEQLDSVLRPLRDQMEQLQELTIKSDNRNSVLGSAMSKDVGEITRIARELSGVASALSSDVRFQGRKGEEILAEKLRQAGLEENVSFFLQTGTESDRPDAQVCDTENRWLLIDSKVSLTAYFAYCEEKDETVKAKKLDSHVKSVRDKITQLARKNYPEVFRRTYPGRDYLPVTVMFVPYEASLSAALRAEPSLWQYAVQSNILLMTPLTLIAFLRIVYLAWQHEKEVENQKEIANVARELLSRMDSFLASFESVGKAIEALGRQYSEAGAVLIDSPNSHSIAKSAKKLLALDVKLEARKGKNASCLRQ